MSLFDQCATIQNIRRWSSETGEKKKAKQTDQKVINGKTVTQDLLW